jgi:hypothetical protein
MILRTYFPRLAAVILLSMLCGRAGHAADFMIQVVVGGERVEGQPLYHSPDLAQMMLRDGRLFEFRPSDVVSIRKSASSFRSYSDGQMRSRLAGEFGNQFEITGTGNYLVVYPRGQKDLWAQRFEDLHRDFVHYFAVRGFKIGEPEFPLIGVVWPSAEEFRRHAIRSGANIGPNVVGYYSPTTNRVHLYDAMKGKHDRSGLQQTASTIIHEVTHQTAFNTGIHTRFAGTPMWVAEGLGTLFEARGVYSSRQYPHQSDRINRERLRSYKARAKDLADGFVMDMISSDQIFQTDPELAYAQAWALTFHLVETQPHRYSKYLAITAERKSGEIYSAAARVADFSSVFGDNYRMHEARLTRYMEGIK